jgi:hypothetical protein
MSRTSFCPKFGNFRISTFSPCTNNKVFHRLIPSALMEYFNVVTPLHDLHSVQDFDFRKLMCRTNIFAKDWVNRRVFPWNSLPSFIVESSFLLHALESIGLSIFLIYACQYCYLIIILCVNFHIIFFFFCQLDGATPRSHVPWSAPLRQTGWQTSGKQNKSY